MLEAFQLYQEGAGEALTPAEKHFIEDAYDRKGCRCHKNSLSLEERRRVTALGEKMLEWKNTPAGRR